MRIDQYITQTYHLSRNRAGQLIEAGLVTIDGVLVFRKSMQVNQTVTVVLQESDPRVHFVSRSALKLSGFLAHLSQKKEKRLLIAGKRALDIGASTGGFSQVLLEQGIGHIDAIDVGRGQLHPSIAADARVTSHEQTDIRIFATALPGCEISQKSSEGAAQRPVSTKEAPLPRNPAAYDIIVCDVSFISLEDIFPAINLLCDEHTQNILLFKPQFEVGKQNLRKKNYLPKNANIIAQARKRFETFLGEQHMQIIACEPSVLPGEAGNQEWLYWIQKMPRV